MLPGDLNVRMGQECSDGDCVPCDVTDKMFDNSTVSFGRVLLKTKLNVFGRNLLSMCQQFNLSILTGSLDGDSFAEFTYISATGCSFIDYFIVSRELQKLCFSLKVVCRYLSKHMSVKMSMLASSKVKVHSYVGSCIYRIIKYTRDENRREDFLALSESMLIKTLMMLLTLLTRILMQFNEGLPIIGHFLKKSY